MDIDMNDGFVQSAASPGLGSERRTSKVSLDDPDVRLAAEALGYLRCDVSSRSQRMLPRSETLSTRPSSLLPTSQTGNPTPQQPEPLLSLLTTSHPFLASTLGGAASAYNSSKHISPVFKSGAEYVEGYLAPIANTVGSVGRVTGVEGSVRWFLGAGRRQNLASADPEFVAGIPSVPVDGISNNLSTCPRMSPVILNIPPSISLHNRRLSVASSVDSLPAYDDYKSPAYSETVDIAAHMQEPPSNPAWQSRLIMSTSGLSLAMSAESLKSLKYCLARLRWANCRISDVIHALKIALQQHDRYWTVPPDSSSITEDHLPVDSKADQSGGATLLPDQSELANSVHSLKADVLRTLYAVFDNVSRYAGGAALPENARNFVRRQLKSLPERFIHACVLNRTSPSSDPESSAESKNFKQMVRSVLVLAKEGLDIVAKVSEVVHGTIVNAEEWCERLGRKAPSPMDEKMLDKRAFSSDSTPSHPSYDPDVDMV